MKLGIYGGAFNPPHLGHIRAAAYGAQELMLDKVLLIPTCISPHKQTPLHTASGQDRLEMLRLALVEHLELEASDLEIARGGQSYTYETILQLKEQCPNGELTLFMGTDMFLSLQNWKNPGIILENAQIGVFYRGEPDEVAAVHNQAQRLQQMGARVRLIENPVTQVSSTMLRSLLVLGGADAYLPKGVGAYIRQKGLYGTDKSKENLPLEQLEEVACTLLKPNRIAHVLGCRDMALALAKRWGADETDVQRAALLHDVTKALDGPAQLTLCDQWDILLDTFSRNNPKTLHALTGSVAAKRVFGENQAVVDAIACHTTGKPDMNTLEKIIYLADAVEQTRDYPEVERLRKLAFADLTEAVKQTLELTLSLLQKRGDTIHPQTAEALAWLQDTANERRI